MNQAPHIINAFSEVIEEGDDDDEEEEAVDDTEVVSDDDDDESVSELITRTVDVSGIIGNNTDVVFIGGAILAVIIAFGETPQPLLFSLYL